MYSDKRARKSQSDRIEQGNLAPSNSDSFLPKIILNKQHAKNSPFSSSSKKKKTKRIITNDIPLMPLLNEDNFFNIIQTFTKYENSLTNKNENLTPNNLKNSNSNKENDLSNSSKSTPKVEILEDGSVCIKNTTGMISPSYNFDNKNINHENENEYLANSKLLVSNNIKVLEDDINESGYQTVNENYNRKYNIFKIDDNQFDYNNSYNKENNTLDEINNYNNNFNFSLIKVPNGVYCSSIKKKKIDKIKNNKISKTTVRKKVILNPKQNKEETVINNKKNLFCEKLQEQENKDILNDWKYLANKLRNSYNNKNNIFRNKLNKKILILKNLKPYNFSNINNNNNKNAIGNIFTFNNNYNNYIRYIENNIEPENESSSKILNSFNNENNNFNSHSLPNNFLSGNHSINNSNQNIISICNQNNTQQSIVEFNENENENSTDSEYIYQATNVESVLNIPIFNSEQDYEKTFNEIILLSEENLNNEEKDEKNDKKKKYNTDIEAIQENINESSEDQESVNNDNKNKINSIKDVIINGDIIINDNNTNDDIINDNNINNDSINENIINDNIKINNIYDNIVNDNSNDNIFDNNILPKNIKKISMPVIDNLKVNIWNKFSNNLNIINKKIDNNHINNVKIQSTIFKEKSKLKKDLKIIQENSIDYSYSIRKSESTIKCDESDDVSVSITKTITEISDDENTDDVSNEKNILQKENPFISYNIINKENNKVKIRFFENIENNNSNKISQIKIQSYLKILKLLFATKKRKPISKAVYENLISIFINNLYCYKNQNISNKNININENNNLALKEKLRNNCIEMDKNIIIFDGKLSDLKNTYLYTLIKKHYIKDQIQKKNFIKQMNIPGKRNEIKKIFKNICYLLNNKINDSDVKKNYIDKIINLLKLYDKLNGKDLSEMKQIIKSEMDNEIKENKNGEKNEGKKEKNITESKKLFEKNKIESKNLFAFMIPVMFIANYFMSNIKNPAQ